MKPFLRKKTTEITEARDSVIFSHIKKIDNNFILKNNIRQ